MSEDQFDGWIAQYELWNIEFDDPIVVEDFRIPLNKREVQLQYERFQKTITSEHKPNGIQMAGKDLALHFPSSIDADLQTFTVLTTVFTRRRSMPSGLLSAGSANAMDIWRPMPMPILHTVHATLLMGLSKSTNMRNATSPNDARASAPTRSQAIRLDRTPAYRLMTYNNYVLYQSIEGRGVLNEEEDMTGTLAIYRIKHAEAVNDISLIGCIEGNGTLGSIHHAVFHPNYPLLAFQFLSRIGDSHIVLWYFGNSGLSRADKFQLLTHDIFLARNMNGGFSISYVANIRSRLKFLQFSACGTNIIYQLHKETCLHTEPIQGSRMYNVAKQENEEEKACNYQLQLDRRLATHSSALEKVNALPQSMALNEPVLHTSSTLTSLCFDSGAANRDIKLVHSADGRNHEQSLLSLPAWSDRKSISASMRMPSRAREEKITIILNKAAQPFYVLGHGSGQTAPAIIRKDIRAIAKPKTHSLASARLFADMPSTSWDSIQFQEESFSNEGEQAKKKICINRV
jgi:hypothetical protein